MVVGDHIAIGRDDEARSQRLCLAGLGLRLAAALTPIEQLGKGRAGKGIVLHLDPLAGGDVDHRRSELLGEVGKAGRRAGNRHHPLHHRAVILGDLRAQRRAGDQRGCRAADQQRARESIHIAHFVHVLLILVFELGMRESPAAFLEPLFVTARQAPDARQIEPSGPERQLNAWGVRRAWLTAGRTPPTGCFSACP